MNGLTSQPVAHPAFIHYPAQAAFGRTLPKSKLYAHGHASTRLKNLFVQQVEQIVWQYKLAPETINLPARPGVPEIEVFGIQLKTRELSYDVLRAIDQAVQFPLIFELTHAGHTQVVACHKRPNEGDASRWVLSDYFTTGWMPASAERAPMPLVLHLGGLYEQLLRTLIPLPARPHESMAALVDRFSQLQALQREVNKTAARLEKERQFNRKVEINARLRQLKSDHAALSR